MRRIFSPVVRITAALVGMTLALVLIAQALRILPDVQTESLLNRKRTVEALTVQLTSTNVVDDLSATAEVLDAVVARSPDVLSAALRDASGEILVAAGNHETFWQRSPDGRSTAEFVRAPIYSGEAEIGAIEVRFAPLPSPWALSLHHGGITALLLYVTLGGGVGYFFVLRRSLRALDPAAVIPDRVRLAMDTLVEGVIIMDEHEQVLLANRAFGRHLEVPTHQLVGKRASEFNWRSAETGGSVPTLPWVKAMATGAAVTDCMLELRAANDAVRTFAVNATPVLDPNGRLRGALASFDDITQMRQQNAELQRTLTQLEESREAIEKHNAELRYLATRDPLTGCMNRRAFFESFGRVFEDAVAKKAALCCAMIDIDLFKQVNDQFGHGTGDRVIAFVAEAIRLHVTDEDLVCRYGGEEYCVVLVSRSLDEAAALFDRIRKAVSRGAAQRFTSRLRLSISCGVTQLSPEDSNPSVLLGRSDAALYAAKADGRDRVVTLISETTPETARRRRLTDVPDPAGGQETGVYRALVTATGLIGAFRDRVTQTLALAERHSWTSALLRIELETAGAMAPRAQKEVLERISALLRRSDILALLLGDHAEAPDIEGLPTTSALGPSELGVLLPDASDVNAIGRVVQRLIDMIGEPVNLDGQETLVGCAIGISVSPSDGTDVDTLMHRAEHARRVVRTGRGVERYAFYQPSMTENLLSTMRIENGLRRALDAGELHLLYQPQVELATGRVRGFEALLRWTDAGGVPIEPDRFIPIAESSGLIVPIGDWVLETVCLQARNWQHGSAAQRIAVNISAVQIMSPAFADRVAAILRVTKVDPRLIDLEITETAFMSDIGRAAATLRELRGLGVHISLDDFGTGYSSLSYLKQLPIDALKIDSRFVKDFNETREGTALVAAIVGMAHGLGIRVVAEGVEKVEVLSMLKQMGCDEAQGFLLAPALPASDAFAFAAIEFAVAKNAGTQRAPEAAVAG